MNRIKNHIPKLVLMLAAGLVVVFSTAANAQENKKQAEKLIIKTQEAFGDLDKVEFNIPGAVELILGDLNVKGRNLHYSKEEGFAELEGDPIKIDYGKNTKMEAGNIVIDVQDSIVTAKNNCVVMEELEDATVRIEAGNFTAAPDAGWINSREPVKIYYSRKAPAEEEEQAAPAEDDGQDEEEGRKLLDIGSLEDLFITAGSLEYRFEVVDEGEETEKTKGTLVATQTVFFEFKDGQIEAERLTGSLEGKRIRLEDGVKGRVKDFSFSSDRIEINSETEEVDIFGDVMVERDNGDSFSTKHLWIKYKEGEGAWKVDGGFQAQIKLKEEESEQNPEEVAP